MRAQNLRCEYLENPIGIDQVQPLLSWQCSDGSTQVAYHIQVASSSEALTQGQADLWDQEQTSAQSVQVSYRGQPLSSKQAVFWRVRLKDASTDSYGAWSAVATWSMGLLQDSDWQGQWLSFPVSGCHDAAYFRKVFSAQSVIKRAVVYATSRGIYEVHLNGQKVNDEYFSPGWTDYNKRIYYRAYDVTAQLQQGDNVLGGVVSEGWYKGQIGFQGMQTLYGYETAIRLQLHIEYENGSVAALCTDETWKTSLGSVLQSSFLMGENVDPAHEPVGWLDTQFDDSTWAKPTCFTEGQSAWSQKHGYGVEWNSNLESHPSYGVAVVGEFPALTSWETDPGTFVYDLGQNFAGWARVKLKGKPGTMVRLRFAEVLQPDKTIYVENLRSASSTDTYIIRSNDTEIFEPRFTFHGFQYVEITGVEELALEDVIGVAVSSDCPRIGSFSCSHVQVNKLVNNAWWTQRANFIDLPTDCPQRDERLGWTGDALAFVNTASYCADVQSFFNKWIQDVIDTQLDNGAVTDTAPCGCFGDKPADAAWGDALTGCPWAIYQFFGDKRLLEKSYPAMKRWLDYYKSTSKDWIREETHCYGDWLDDNDQTAHPVLLTAYFAFSARICADVAAALGLAEEEQQYRSWWEHIVSAFQERFFKDGIVESDSQTSLVVALDMDLLPVNERAAAAERLVQKIKDRDYRLSTGFVGTHLLLPVLSRFGHTAVAYKLLTQTAYPSWLFPIEQGATSIWERWNGWTPENGPGDPSMNSYAHYAFGAVVEWLYAHVAGIKPIEPGFKQFSLAPEIGDELDFVNCRYESVAGPIVSNWKRDGNSVAFEFEVPSNTQASLRLPGCVTAGLEELTAVDGVYQLTAGAYSVQVMLEECSG